MEHERARVSDPVGLHLRAASRIVREAKAFESEITIAYQGISANAKSILGLASLVAKHDEVLELTAEGPDARAALDALRQLIEVGLADNDGGRPE